MIDPETLTRDAFLGELLERVDTLRLFHLDVPAKIDAQVSAVVGGPDDPFEQDVFRLAAAHLLAGIDPEIVSEDGGADLLEDRLAALAANLQLSLRVAAERHEQAV